MVVRRLILLACILTACKLQPCRLEAQPAAEADYTREEMALLPTPDWVQMRDVDEGDPRLAGLRVPAGVSVEIVAENPLVIDPVGMTFADDGSLYVLEWREATEQIDTTYDVKYQDGTTATVNRKTKNVKDELKRLFDTDHDGVYDRAELVMDDLEMPSSMLEHDGWMYFPSVGHVIRRRPADSGSASFAEEEILRGLCGYHHHQASGLTLSHDNWMYTTTGDDDNIVEGSDGSRATVLRTGAIFRSRPDGSQLSEFARGFRNPYRNVVFDEAYNMFHVDNDQEDGSKFQGVRLMHLLEGADYGWRLEMGAKCCRTDFARGAVFGERPGKMPSMLKTGRGAPGRAAHLPGHGVSRLLSRLADLPRCVSHERSRVRSRADRQHVSGRTPVHVNGSRRRHVSSRSSARRSRRSHLRSRLADEQWRSRSLVG